MINPIEKEFKRLFPEEKLTSAQARAISRAKNPQEIADNLESNYKELVKLFETRLGEGVATDSDIVKLLPLDFVTKGYGDVSLDFLLRPLGHVRAFELGKKANDFWGNLYRKYLNRDPDPEGLEWWTSTIEHWFKKGIK